MKPAQQTSHDHAVTHLNGAQKFWYDANGNMITRTEGSATFVQQWNFENRLTTVISGSQITQFIYDDDPTPHRSRDFAATACCK